MELGIYAGSWEYWVSKCKALFAVANFRNSFAHSC